MNDLGYTTFMYVDVVFFVLTCPTECAVLLVACI
jgi:hypothetical protein